MYIRSRTSSEDAETHSDGTAAGMHIPSLVPGLHASPLETRASWEVGKETDGTVGSSHGTNGKGECTHIPGTLHE